MNILPIFQHILTPFQMTIIYFGQTPGLLYCQSKRISITIYHMIDHQKDFSKLNHQIPFPRAN